MKRHFPLIATAMLVAGMVLAACAPAAAPAPAPTKAPAPTQAPEPTKPPEPTQAPEPTKAPEPTATVEPTKAPEPTPAGPTPTPTPVLIKGECSGEAVTVRVHDWSSADRQEYWDQVIKAFVAANPCINVESVKLADDRAIRLTEITGGTAPDLIGSDSSDIPRTAMIGGLMDLTPLMAEDKDFKPEEIFYSGPWKGGFFQDKPVAIAKDYSVSAFYINTSLFEKAGIEIPKEGWTYDDFLEMAKQLTVDKNGNNANSPDFDPKNVAVWGASSPWWGGTSGWWRGFQSFLYSWGAKTISADGKTTQGYLNSDAAVKAWSWWRDLIHKYHVAPSATDLAATNLGNDKLFTQGQLAIASTYWGPWFQDVFNQTPDLKWQVVPLPTGPGGHKAAIMWMGWGIYPKSQHPKEAWALLKWLTTEPGQRVFALKAMTGDKAIAKELQKTDDPYWKVFLDEAQYQDTLDDTTSPFYTTCVDIPASEMIGKLFSEGGDKLDLKAELDKLAESADKCIATSK